MCIPTGWTEIVFVWVSIYTVPLVYAYNDNVLNVDTKMQEKKSIENFPYTHFVSFVEGGQIHVHMEGKFGSARSTE